MTTIPEIQDLAGTLHSQRPDWDLIPTVNYLLPHRDLPYDELSDLATAWASNPKNRTPASLKYLPGLSAKSAESDVATRTNNNPPDHLRARVQAIADCAWCDHHGRLPNGYLCPHDDMDERAARAKERADRARIEIKPMIKTKGERVKPQWHDEETPTCTVCGGTLAVVEEGQTTHPGCTPQEATA